MSILFDVTFIEVKNVELIKNSNFIFLNLGMNNCKNGDSIYISQYPENKEQIENFESAQRKLSFASGIIDSSEGLNYFPYGLNTSRIFWFSIINYL